MPKKKDTGDKGKGGQTRDHKQMINVNFKRPAGVETPIKTDIH